MRAHAAGFQLLSGILYMRTKFFCRLYGCIKVNRLKVMIVFLAELILARMRTHHFPPAYRNKLFYFFSGEVIVHNCLFRFYPSMPICSKPAHPLSIQ